MKLVAFIFEHPSYVHAVLVIIFILTVPAKSASEIEVSLNHLLSKFVTLVTNVSVEANSVDQDQTAPTGVV